MSDTQKEKIKKALKSFESKVFSHLTKTQARVICVIITAMFLLLYYFTPAGRIAINLVGYICFTLGMLYLGYLLYQYASSKASKEPKEKKAPEEDSEPEEDEVVPKEESEADEDEIVPEEESEADEDETPPEEGSEADADKAEPAGADDTEEANEKLPFEPDDSDESVLSEEEEEIVKRLNDFVNEKLKEDKK